MRSFAQFVQEEVPVVGTYMAVYYTLDAVEENILRHYRGIVPDLFEAPEIHTTLMYARSSPIDAYGRIPPTLVGANVWVGKPRYEILGEDARCLTIAFESDILTYRHLELRRKGLVHSYDTFVPHITLRCGWEGDIKSLPPLKPFNLPVLRETIEPIVENKYNQ